MSEELLMCECGSGDIRYCQISVRYYCNECGNWPPPHWDKPSQARKQWNDWISMAKA